VLAVLREVPATKLAKLIGERPLAAPDDHPAICNVVLPKLAPLL
jgi:hypothetical protein